MNENLSTDTARIRALKTAMISLLGHQGGENIRTERVREAADFLISAYQGVLNSGSQQLLKDSARDVHSAIGGIQDTYADWREIDNAFNCAIALAYNGTISRKYLHLDSIHADMKRWIGEPIASLYTRLHSMWQGYLEVHPWDLYMSPAGDHIDGDRLNENLQLLLQGDHLDVEDAIENLTGTLRYLFAHFLEKGSDRIDLLEEGLWMRPEIVVINDYWRHKPQLRILDLLRRRSGSKLAASFAGIQDFMFDNAGLGCTEVSERVTEKLKKVPEKERDGYYRCLMLHPDQEIRRYAATNVDIEGFWKVITPRAVPCATILSMLEKVVGSKRFDQNFQKIFFDAIYRRLLSLTSRSDVLYARGIVRVYAQLPFFMEDQYFEKLIILFDYLSSKEKAHKMRDSLLEDYINNLRDEKQKIGNFQPQAPTFTSVPPVVLRKLARDGHFWYDLAMHPMFKIARETIAHIKSPDRAIRVAKNRRVNQDVLREIGKRTSLFKTLSAKMALLSNPRTPPAVSLMYVADLSQGEVQSLLRKSSVHPELRPFLNKRLNARL
jgi:hypothetical protein